MYTVELLFFLGLSVAWSSAKPMMGSGIFQALGSEAISQALNPQAISQALNPQAISQALGTQDISQALGIQDFTQALGTQDISQVLGTEDFTQALSGGLPGYTSLDIPSQYINQEDFQTKILSSLGLQGLQPRDFTIDGFTNIGLDLVEESAEGSSSQLVKLLGLTQLQGQGGPVADFFLGILIFVVGFIGSLVGLGPSKIEQLINTAAG